MIKAMKYKGFKSLCKLLIGMSFCFLAIRYGMMAQTTSVEAKSCSYCGSFDASHYPELSVGVINKGHGYRPLHKTWTSYVLSTEPLNI